MKKQRIISIATILILFSVLFLATIENSYAKDDDVLRLGITRFVNPRQYFTHRHIGLELQKYLVYNLRNIEHLKALHKRASDRVILNASADDIKEIYNPEAIEKANEHLQAHLLLMGSYDVTEDNKVVCSFAILNPRTFDKVRTFDITADADNLIPFFNQVLQRAIKGSNKIFNDIEVVVNENLSDVLSDNENLNLFTYNMFVEVEKAIAKEDYLSAIEDLKIMTVDGKDLKRIYQIMAFCYEQVEDWNNVFLSYLNLFEQDKDKITKKKLLEVYWQIGKNFILANNLVESRPYLELALGFAKELNIAYEEAEIKFDIAKSYFDNNETAEAVKIYNEVLEINKKIKNQIGLCKTYLILADLAKENLKYPEMLSYSQEVLKIAKTIEYNDYICSANLNIVDIRLVEGKYDDARNIAEETLNIAKETGNQYLIARSYFAIGQLYEKTVVYQTAMTAFRKCFDIAKATMDFDLMEQSSYKIGIIKKEYCDCPALETQLLVDNHIKLSDIFEEYTKDYANFRNIGLILSERNNFKDAVNYIQKAVEVSTKTQILKLKVIDFTDLAKLYIELKDFDKAFLYYANSLELAEGIEDAPIITWQYLHIGEIFKLKNNLDNALESFEQSLELASLVKDPNLTLAIYRQISDIYLTQRKMDKYEETMKKAIALAEKIGSPLSIEMKNELDKEAI